MIEEKIIEAVSREFAQKFRETMKDLSTEDLSPELAEKFSEILKQSISTAAVVGYQTFIESYDVKEELLEIEGKRMRYKCPSKKSF